MNSQNKFMECISIALFIAAGVIYLISAHKPDNAAVFEIKKENERVAGDLSAYESGTQASAGNTNTSDSHAGDESGEKLDTQVIAGNKSTDETKEDDLQDLVNINIADEAGLMTLPGIGQTRAAAIIEYRNSCGGFERKEDIMQVSGIKEGIFSKIKDLITVD